LGRGSARHRSTCSKAPPQKAASVCRRSSRCPGMRRQGWSAVLHGWMTWRRPS
jgi:hypothetical protein